MGEKKYNATRFFDEAVNDYDAKREFLKFLLKAGKNAAEKSADNEFSDCDRYCDRQLYDYECDCQVAGCAFDMPDDNMKYYDTSVEKCIIYEDVDIDKLYEELSLLLPEKREITRDIAKIRLDYGTDFMKKKEVLENFKKSVCTKDMLSQAQKIRTEIQVWTERIENKTVEKSFGEKYIAVLHEKIKILEDTYYNEAAQVLKEMDFDIRSEKECKNQLLERLRNIRKFDFDTGVSLYKDYCAKEKQLEELMGNHLVNMDDLMISQYAEFYRLGKILISNRLNQINNNPAEKRQIPQGDIDCAMKYFYETETPQEAYNLQEEVEYLDNRKKGEIGEKEVDYALKWLDKSYMVVPKMKSKKHGQQSIELINLDFIDEVQEYDHIVIGKQGVFVIETKNYAGKLIVDTNGNWIRVQKDGTNEGERNPVQQVDRHTKLLKSFLKEGIPVIGLICIAHPQAIIEGGDNSPIPLLKSDLLTRFIESYPSGNRVLSDDEMKECLLRIEEHRY